MEDIKQTELGAAVEPAQETKNEKENVLDAKDLLEFFESFEYKIIETQDNEPKKIEIRQKNIRKI